LSKEQRRRQTTSRLSLGQKLDDVSLLLSLLQCLACSSSGEYYVCTFLGKEKVPVVVQCHVCGAYRIQAVRAVLRANGLKWSVCNPGASSTAAVSSWLQLVHKVRLERKIKNLHSVEGKLSLLGLCTRESSVN
jgi:transcription elongation factor Elf1